MQNNGYLYLWGLLILLFHGNEASCDLSGSAWALNQWRDIMRGTSLQTCDLTSVGNGKCDYTNNMANNQCQMDGGDCCMTTCFANCISRQSAQVSGSNIPYSNPSGISSQCEYMCGVRASPFTNCPYLCLDDSYMGKASSFSSWCNHNRGAQSKMSDCYATYEDIVTVFQECLMDDRAHGNSLTAHSRCGNQSLDCTLSDVLNKIDGCDMHPSSCTNQACCSVAISNNYINPGNKVMPSKCELNDVCAADPQCFSTMAQCVRTNKACLGGCCKCNSLEWYGHNCDQPLCWPRCQHGKCVAPNTCHCDADWSGVSCEIPVCKPSCVVGQGVCVSPNVCECFYGYEGDQCQTPKSTPPCINGYAVAPDSCVCYTGWGGRICDYPICQSYPNPSVDCGHGICEAPWRCKCEPGWSLTIPVGIDGKDVVPTFWRGRDTSVIVSETDFVFGDTRFNQTGPTSHLFDEYNAYKCNTPDCRLLTDAFCSICADKTAECLKCDSGYYLSNSRCLSCSLRFSSCRQCDASRCLACDPLFALVDGNCVSDGIFEFSSSIYHVSNAEQYCEVTVIRTIDSILNLDWNSRNFLERYGLTLTVQTVADANAVAQSSTEFSDFEMTSVPLHFPAVTLGSGRDSYVLKRSVHIPIYDNMIFDRDARSFQVRLIGDPEAVSGSSVPLRPIPGMLGDSALDPLPISEATVVIYDTSVFDLSTCFIKDTYLNDTDIHVSTTASSFTVPVKCSLCEIDAEGKCLSLVSFHKDGELVRFVTNSSYSGTKPILSDTATGQYDAAGFLLVNVSNPREVSKNFDVYIQAVFPGTIVQQYLLSAVPTTGQIPDLTRKEPVIDTTWALSQQAPALVLYSGYLNMKCFDSTNLPGSIGVAISKGAHVSLVLAGELVINTARTYGDIYTEADWQAPPEDSWCGDDLNGLFCFNKTGTGYMPDELVPFEIAFKTSQAYYQRPSGIRFLYCNSTGSQTWKVIPSECLLAAVDIYGSPIRGFITV
jgi:hypothetical protein